MLFLLLLLYLVIITLIRQSRSLVEEAVLFTLHVTWMCIVFSTLWHRIWELVFKQVTHIYWQFLATILVDLVQNICQLRSICSLALVRWRQKQHLFHIRVWLLFHLVHWVVILDGAILITVNLPELLVCAIFVGCLIIIAHVLVKIVRLQYLFLVTWVLGRYIMTLIKVLRLRFYPVVAHWVFGHLLACIWILNLIRVSHLDTKHSFMVNQHFRW